MTAAAFLFWSFVLQPEAKLAAALMHAIEYRYVTKRDACIGSAGMHVHMRMHV